MHIICTYAKPSGITANLHKHCASLSAILHKNRCEYKYACMLTQAYHIGIKARTRSAHHTVSAGKVARILTIATMLCYATYHFIFQKKCS